MEDQGTIKVVEGNILERIRQRPAMYLGKHSLTALCHFVMGYSLGQGEFGVEPSPLIPRDFHDWVAYRLHLVESTSGYASMILKQTPDEEEALARFFELLDQYFARRATTIARIRRHPKDHKIKQPIKGPDGRFSDSSEVLGADEVSIVIFTDDPGFFLVNDDPSRDHPRETSFLPSLSWLYKPYRPDPEFTTVLVQEQFDRLSREAASFEEARNEEQELHRPTLGERDKQIN